MNLDEIKKFQKEFDGKHGWNWTDSKTFGEKLRKLHNATVAILGELGEFANVLKKLRRLYESKGERDDALLPNLKEELVDVFIYLVVLANILDVDLEKEYFEKMRANEERFKEFRGSEKS